MDKDTLVGQMLSPEGRVDPYPLYRSMHDIAPVLGLSTEYVALARYSDCDRVLRDSRFRVVDAEWHDRDGAADWRDHLSVTTLAESVVSANPPDHARARRHFSRAFSPRRLARLRDDVDRIAGDLVERIAKAGEDGSSVDFVAEFGYRLPITVISAMLGVPPSDREWFRPLAFDLALATEPHIDTSLLGPADKSAATLRDYFASLVAYRRREPCDDLITALAVIDGSDEDAMPESEPARQPRAAGDGGV